MQIFGAMEILGNWLSSQDTFLAFMSMNKTMIFLNNINQIFDVAFSFVNVPDITQETYSNIVTISWTDRNLNLSKCVDYFYVEHAEIANG